jgi:hypothetical protein
MASSTLIPHASDGFGTSPERRLLNPLEDFETEAGILHAGSGEAEASGFNSGVSKSPCF